VSSLAIGSLRTGLTDVALRQADSALLKLPVGIARWGFTRNASDGESCSRPAVELPPFHNGRPSGETRGQAPNGRCAPGPEPPRPLWCGGSRLLAKYVDVLGDYSSDKRPAESRFPCRSPAPPTH